MPQLIVDILEVIEIEVENGEMLVQSDRPRESTLKTFKESQSVWQICQFVRPDLSLGLNLLADPSGDLRGVNEYAF